MYLSPNLVCNGGLLLVPLPLDLQLGLEVQVVPVYGQVNSQL